MRPTATVRIGATLRRPAHERSDFVAGVLAHLRAHGFDGAPLALGFDDQGRQVFEWIEGEVPETSPFLLDDRQLLAAAALVRRLHETLAGFPGLQPGETVRHGDLGPHNTVFRDGLPVAVIDWDDGVRPGSAADDAAQAIWGYADLLEPSVPIERQRHGLHLMCAEYGIAPGTVLDELAARFERAAADHRRRDRPRGEAIFRQLIERLDADRPALLSPRRGVDGRGARDPGGAGT